LIEDEDNAQSLSETLSRIGADLIVETLDKMRKGVITPIPQSGESSYAPQLKKKMAKLTGVFLQLRFSILYEVHIHGHVHTVFQK